MEDFYSTVNKDTFRLKELRFSGVHDRYYIQKGMYDNFGKWEQSIYKKQYDTLLVWNDVRILNDTGGKDKETSTVLPQSNIQKNNDIVKDYLTFQPMTIFTPDYWYCNSVEFNAIAQYYKCGYDVFAKEDWDSWYESQGQDMISTEERKYLPFVNYIKMLGYNYE